MEGKNLYLKPKEVAFLSMAVLAMLEDLQATSTDININWNPEARSHIKDMLNSGKDLKLKMEKLGFDMKPLPPYESGEEKDYLTKMS